MFTVCNSHSLRLISKPKVNHAFRISMNWPLNLGQSLAAVIMADGAIRQMHLASQFEHLPASSAGAPPHQKSLQPHKGSQNSKNLRNAAFLLSAFTAPKHTRDTLAGWYGMEITQHI